VQIHRTDGLWYSAEYSTFSISDEVGKYRLTVDGYSGDAGNALMTPQWPNWISNGMMFTTQDSDNDLRVNDNCGRWGGWWYGQCSTSDINKNGDAAWKTYGSTKDVQASRMLVKLN